mgnify:CR=1 FL=1
MLIYCEFKSSKLSIVTYNLEKLYKEVEEDYNNNRETLVEFFTNHGFDKEQSAKKGKSPASVKET